MVTVAILCSVSAGAATVTFNTLGQFFAGGPDVVTVAPISFGLSGTAPAGSLATPVSGTARMALSFTGLTGEVSADLPSDGEAIGAFDLRFTKDAQMFAGNDTFQLTIQQTDPGSATGMSSATVSGTVTLKKQAGSNTAATLSIIFNNGNPIHLTAAGQDFYYLIEPIISTGDFSAPADFHNTLFADISVAPVPATASLGLSLLGGLGCVQVWSLRRRRITVAA
jgi:hypothetical protein